MYTAKIYRADPSKFGGIVYPSDFNTESRGRKNNNGSPIARRIEMDDRFDWQCRKQKGGH